MAEEDTRPFVEMECVACKATGVYHGMSEPEGVGVVCRICDGSGGVKLHYTPFTGRHGRGDITEVHWPWSNLPVLGDGPAAGSVTYREFLEGKMPPR